jgi:integrase
MPLNYLQCENAKPQQKSYLLSDGDGLYLQITPSGNKYWQYRFRFHGKQRCLSLGSYAITTLAEARVALRAAQKDIQQNIDPILKKKAERQTAQFEQSQTFKDIALEWYELNKSDWTPRHAAYVLRRLELHVFDEIGNYPISQITAPIITACLKKVQKTGIEMGYRIKSMVSRIFNYAIGTGRIERDLTIGLNYSLKKYRQKHYAAVTLDELPPLVKKIYTNDARLYRQTHLCLKLMLLTAVRTCELIEARWTEFDFEKSIWIIPAERMKTRKLHKVPLSNQALILLRELKELNGKRDFVFPSISRPRKPMSNATILKALANLGYKYKMTGHGFRSIYMGVCKQHLGYRHEPVDRQLAHEPRSSVDRAYDRADYLPERIIMMQEYADYIDCILHDKPYQRKNDDDRSKQLQPVFGYSPIAPYGGGNQTTIGYRAASFVSKSEAGNIPETIQRSRQQNKLLEVRGCTNPH